MGRWRRVPPEASELPRVSGAGAGRLASVSRAASSQDPEPGPAERGTRPHGGCYEAARGLAHLSTSASPTPGWAAGLPSPSLASGSSSSSPFSAGGSAFSSSDSWPSTARRGKRSCGGLRAGAEKSSGMGLELLYRTCPGGVLALLCHIRQWGGLLLASGPCRWRTG